MKNFFKGSALMLLFAFVFASCSKDQALTNNIAGVEWDVLSYTVDGVDQLSSLGDHPTMYFNTCSINNTDWCTGYMTANRNVMNFSYIIEDKGAKMELMWAPMLGAQGVSYLADITNEGKKDENFTFSYTNSENQVIEYQLGVEEAEDHDHDEE